MAIFSLVIGLFLFALMGGICVVLVLLQIFLSKKESIWPGLVMPMLSLGFSLLILFGMAAYSTVGSKKSSEAKSTQKAT